jgi:hypothetical protein
MLCDSFQRSIPAQPAVVHLIGAKGPLPVMFVTGAASIRRTFSSYVSFFALKYFLLILSHHPYEYPLPIPVHRRLRGL